MFKLSTSPIIQSAVFMPFPDHVHCLSLPYEQTPLSLAALAP